MFKPLKKRIVKIKWWFGFTGITQYPYIFILDPNQKKWLDHEVIHFYQQEQWFKWGWFVGTWIYRVLYYLALPVGWNPLRYKMELEAYMRGSRLSEKQAKNKIRKSYLLWWI